MTTLKTIHSSVTSLLSIALLTTLFLVTGCGGKDDGTPTPSAQDAVKSKLIANTWKIQTVKVDGTDQTSIYNGMTLKFTSTGFTASSGAPVWPASGSWSFNSTDGSTILRSDGITVSTQVTDATLRLTLTWTSTTLGGRTPSVGGVNVFSFVK